MIKFMNSLVRKASLRKLEVLIHQELGSFIMAMELSNFESNTAVYFIARRSSMRNQKDERPEGRKSSFMIGDDVGVNFVFYSKLIILVLRLYMD